MSEGHLPEAERLWIEQDRLLRAAERRGRKAGPSRQKPAKPAASSGLTPNRLSYLHYGSREAAEEAARAHRARNRVQKSLTFEGDGEMADNEAPGAVVADEPVPENQLEAVAGAEAPHPAAQAPGAHAPGAVAQQAAAEVPQVAPDAPGAMEGQVQQAPPVAAVNDPVLIEQQGPVAAAPGVVVNMPDFAGLSPELQAFGRLMIVANAQNTHATVENLRISMKAENDDRYARKDEAADITRRIENLEIALNECIDDVREDLSRIRDQVPDRPLAAGSRRLRSSAPGALQDDMGSDAEGSVDDGDYVSRAWDMHQMSKGRHVRGVGESHRSGKTLARTLPFDGEQTHRSGKMTKSHSPAPGAITDAHGYGPAVSYLPEIKPADPRFAHLTSYRRYRPANRARHAQAYDRSKISTWRKNMESLMDMGFDGGKPIKIIAWLDTFKQCCDDEYLPECIAVTLADRFLHGEAKRNYDQARAAASATNEDGGFTTWPGAVNHLVSVNLTNAVLEDAFRAIQDSAQEDGQPVRQYFTEFTKRCRRLPGVLTSSDKISTCIRGLRPALVTDATLKRSKYESKLDGLHQLVTYLERRE